MLIHIRTSILTLLVFIFLGCQKHIPQKGMWTGTIIVTKHKLLPFTMFLNLNSNPPAGYFLNGNEATQIPEIQLQNDSLSFIFSEYSAAMLGVWNGKEWRGKFIRYRSDTNWNECSLSPSELAQSKEPAPHADVTLVGKFQAFIAGEKGVDSTTMANFWMKNDSIYGTLIAPDGDEGLFVGTQNGSKVTLSRFTGWQAFVMELEQQGSGWKGTLYARSGVPMTFSLIPRLSGDPEPTPERGPTMKVPKTPFSFFGTTPAGQMISSTDNRFIGKALIIDIMGTWCHNCMDATPLLQQLYSEFNTKGLEIVGLAFEISDKPELAKKNITLFQNRYGITYPLLFCGSTKDSNVKSKILSQLNDFSGYPTTVFVDRKGSVKEIHVGFKGPATGEEYQRQVQQYYKIVRDLLK
jgi:thiol-disulfide isomerase/thioredoxin